MADTFDLIVVGAGATGLHAARLAEAAGLDVLVLEASPRVGGRILTEHTAAGDVVDSGAQLLNGDMPRALARVAEAGGALRPLPTGGDTVVAAMGRVQRMTDAPSILPRLADVPADAIPSGVALADWLDGLDLDPAARLLAESEIREMYGQPTAQLDARAACAVARSFDSTRPEAEFQLERGMEPVFTHLAAGLQRAPCLDTPARSIVEHADHASVATNDDELQARHVLVAVSPPVAARIDFRCDDGAALREALGAWINGDLIKFHLLYARAFWRDAGRSGAAVIADTCGLSVLDTTLDAPRLTAFLGGTLAREWSAHSEAARTQRLLDALEPAFGPEVRRPRVVQQTAWIDHPWYGGAYHAHRRAGAPPDAMERLMARQGRIRFAAAELTHRFNGYIEGAFESAELALADLLQR
jgi:monoamine oxidase